MRLSQIFITPEEAQEILSRSEGVFKNRKVRQSTVEMYAKDMAEGRWTLNGETIKLTSEGILIDGQHRLNAVRRCGIPIEFIVAEGVSPDAEPTIDIGNKRSLENALQFQGKAYETGASSVVRLAMTLRRRNYQIGHSDANMRISRLEQLEEFMENEEMYNAMTKYGCEVYRDSYHIINKPEAGAIAYHLTRDLGWDMGIVREFFSNLVNASNMEKSIFQSTKQKLFNKKICRNADRIKAYIACWNSMLKGNRVRCQFNDGDWFMSNAEYEKE